VCGCVQLKCCGSASYEDWYEIDWSGTGVVDAVPRSCCNQTAVTAEHQCDGTAVDDIYTVVRSNVLPTAVMVTIMMNMLKMTIFNQGC